MPSLDRGETQQQSALAFQRPKLSDRGRFRINLMTVFTIADLHRRLGYLISLLDVSKFRSSTAESADEDLLFGGGNYE